MANSAKSDHCSGCVELERFRTEIAQSRGDVLANAQAIHDELSMKIAVLTTRMDCRDAALAVAKVEVDRRLEEHNGFRGQLADERRTYLTRDLYDRAHAALIDKAAGEHKALSDRLTALELASSRLGGSMWAIGAAVSAVVTIATVIIDFYFKSH